MHTNHAFMKSIIVLAALLSVSACTVHYPDAISVTKARYISPAPVISTQPKKVPARQAAPVIVHPVSVQRPAVMAPQPKPVAVVSSQFNQVELDHNLLQAAKSGNIQAVNRWLGEGASVNAANANGETALHEAAASGNTAIANTLIQNRANINARTVKGWTPLHLSARFGRMGVAQLLVSKGAAVSFRTADGKTAAQLASMAHHPSIASLLSH
jgi:ankyrin